MLRRIDLFVVFVAFSSCIVCAAELPTKVITVHQYPAQKFSLAEYSSELDELAGFANDALQDKTAAATALSDFHGEWIVESAGQSFTINTDWLTDEFEKLQKNPTSSV